MMTGTKVEGHPSLAIWTSRAVTYTSSSLYAINSAVRVSGIGKTQEKRSFLRSGCSDPDVVRGVNDVRQSCIALFLDDPRWPPDLLARLKKGLCSG